MSEREKVKKMLKFNSMLSLWYPMIFSSYDIDGMCFFSPTKFSDSSSPSKWLSCKSRTPMITIVSMVNLVWMLSVQCRQFNQFKSVDVHFLKFVNNHSVWYQVRSKLFHSNVRRKYYCLYSCAHFWHIGNEVCYVSDMLC